MENKDLETGKNRTITTNNNYYVEVSHSEWTSWLVPMIVVANIVVFVIAMYMNDCLKNTNDGQENCVATFLGRFSFQPLKENPLFGPSSNILEKLGALEWEKVVHEHQGWRLISCMWLHAGVVHLLANMLSLVFIGIRLEQQFGFVRVGIVYLVSGLGGSVLSSLFLQHSISVGASGALFGLLGAMLSELLTNWTIYSNKVTALITFLVIIGINLALGMLPHVDNFAHIGGFLTGLLLGFVLLIRPQYGYEETQHLRDGARVKSKYNACQLVFSVLAGVLVIVGLTMGLVLLFRGKNGNDYCSWCQHLSCIRTSKWSCGN